MTPKKSSLVSTEVNNSVLIMAPTGYGKSWLLGTLAMYVWRVYRKVTLFYSSDGGGYPMNVQALIKLGIMRVWQLRSRTGLNDALALETTMSASRGWWPERINPLSGVCDPNCKLVPPVTAIIEVLAPDGTLITILKRESEAQGRTFTHPKTKAKLAPTQWQLRRTFRPTTGFEDVGAVCFDGLTSCSDMWMDDLAGRHGRLELVSKEKNPLGGTVHSGQLKLGGNNWADYGFAQRRAAQMVANARSIPGLVVPPVFTALTLDMTDEKTQLAICGPALAGNKATPVAGQWFGNVLEPSVYQNDQGHDCYRLYVDKWVESPEAGGRRHLTKNRADPGVLPRYLDDPHPTIDPDDPDKLLYPEAGSRVNLGVFFELLEQGLAVRLASLGTDPDFKDAPGVPTEMTYGDPTAAPTTIAVTVPKVAVTVPKVKTPEAHLPGYKRLKAGVAVVGASAMTAVAAPQVTTVQAPKPAPRTRAKPVPAATKPVPAKATAAPTMQTVPAAPPGSPMTPATAPPRP